MKIKNKLEHNRKINFFFNRLYNLLFGEKFRKKISYNFKKNISRTDLILYSINKRNFNSYLEIGCYDDFVFSKVNLVEKVGVDPNSGGNYRATSDDFFLQNKNNFDCIFIDGLHEYSQVIKDIKNSLEVLNENGLIFLHDCLPESVGRQRVPRDRYTWNGDVWKAIVEARTWKNCDTRTCLIDHGISIIEKKPNQDLLEIETTKFQKLKFKFFYENYKKLMRTQSYEDTIKNI